MLRISRATETGSVAGTEVLLLEGQVTGRWVEELRRVCDEIAPANRQGERPLTLDLAQVSFLDTAGISLVRALTGGGARVARCSLFVAEQLKEVADVDK